MTSFAISLAINGAVFFSMDRAITQNPGKNLFFMPKSESKKEIVQFEFVEAPPVPAQEKPKKNKMIAARDSNASDATQGSKKENAPKAVSGTANQLTQRPTKGAPPTPAAPAAPQESPEDRLPSFKKPAMPRVKRADAAKPAADAWMPGNGKILTQEMVRAKSKGARFYGVTSFEATGSGMGVYMEKLKEKIWGQWFPYIAFKFPRDFRGAEAVLNFKIDAQGQVRSVRILEYKGTPIFAAFCQESVERVGNFGPLPKEILALTGKDELDINFGFHYG